jgi:endonuclease/exonuclease/phosphatase family metal-dependent hydrolase
MRKFIITLYLYLIPVLLFSQNGLNIMTFNIRLDLESDSLNSWKFRKDNFISQVLFHQVNILGVQEALPHQMKDIQKGLTAFKYAGVARDERNEWSEFSAIFYDTTKLTLLSQETFWLSENIAKVGSVGWDAACPRIVTWVKLKEKMTSRIFFVFNTHFDHKGEVARRNSAKLLLSKVNEIAKSYPVIVIGDFNSHPADEPIQIITDRQNVFHLTDSKGISKTPHYGPMGTFNGFQSKEESDEPIDYIFVKNKVKVLQHATFSQSWGGHFSSDHFPVFAKVSVDD